MQMESDNKNRKEDDKGKKGLAMETAHDQVFDETDEVFRGDKALLEEDMGVGNDSENPFRRKSGLMRTPPLRRTLSLPEERRKGGSLARDDERVVREEEKRKREEDSPTEKIKKDKRPKEENSKTTEEARKGKKKSTTQRASSISKRGNSPDLLVVVSDSEDAAEKEPVRKSRTRTLPECVVQIERKTLQKQIELEKSVEGLVEEQIKHLGNSFKEISELVEKVNKIAKTLADLVLANSNTKVEIKRGIEDLGWTASRLGKRGAKMAQPIQEIGKMMAERNKRNTRDRKEIAVQTDKEPWQIRNAASVNKIREVIAQKRSYDGFKRQADIKWPLDVFINTKVLPGNPIWENSEGNIAIYTGRRDNLDKGVGRQFLRKFPEVVDLVQGDKRDSIHLITYEVKVDGNRSSRSASVITVEEDEEKEYETINKWKDKLKDEGIKRVAVVFMDADIRTRRKLLEHVFWGEEIKVLLYETETKSKSKKSEKKRYDPPQRKTSGPQKGKEAVIVSAEGKSYADLLRIVKGKVDAAAIGVEIEAVRKTKTGELLLTIDGGQDKTKILKSEMQTRCKEEGVKIRGGRRDEMVLHIKGIDPTTSKEEIEREILSVIGDDEEAIFVKSLRPAFGGNNNITITVQKNIGERLMAKGNLRLGWSSCRISERVEVKKCFKCWGIGHRINECNGPDRRSLCLRCGRDSHKAADCRETPRCPICKVEGHRADSMMCPVIREEIRRTRDRNAMERISKGSTERETGGGSSQGGHRVPPERTTNMQRVQIVQDTDTSNQTRLPYNEEPADTGILITGQLMRSSAPEETPNQHD